MFQKQIKFPDFSDVIHTTGKNELNIMWLSRNTKLLDSFSSKKVNASSMWSGYCLGSVKISTFSVTSINDVPIIEGKRIIDQTDCMCPQHSLSELQHKHLFLHKTDLFFWEINEEATALLLLITDDKKIINELHDRFKLFIYFIIYLFIYTMPICNNRYINWVRITIHFGQFV